MVTRASARKKLRVKGPLTAFDEFIMGKDNGLRPRTFSPHSCWVERQVIQIQKTSKNKTESKEGCLKYNIYILCNSNILQQKQRTAKQRTFTSLQIAPLNIQCHMTFTLVSPLHCESFSSRACSCADIHLRTANSFKPPAAVPRSEAERRRLGLVNQNYAEFNLC